MSYNNISYFHSYNCNSLFHKSKSDKVHKSIKVESALLCKKISEILSETESGHDVLQETVVFYSRTRQWCDSNMSSTVSS